jgi:uncharacterized lipoprotein YmbA
MSSSHPITRSLWALALLAGCTTTTVHLYTLAPAPTFATIEVADAHASFVIAELRIPSSVDRKQLIRRGAGNELVILENHQWAAPLRDEVRGALIAYIELAVAQGGTPVATSTIEVSITEWDATGTTVYFKAEWRLRRTMASTPQEIRCNSAFRESTSGTPADLIRADQALVRALAQPIARALRNSPITGCSG